MRGFITLVMVLTLLWGGNETNETNETENNDTRYAFFVNHSPSQVNSSGISTQERIYWFVSGALLSLSVLGIMYALNRRQKRKKKGILPVYKNEKELLHLLLPHSQNSRVLPLITKIEENIYRGAGHKISPKEVKEVLKMLFFTE